MAGVLSRADVDRLAADQSAVARAETAAKIAGSLDTALSPAERALADEVCRQFTRDAAVEVRAALAESLKHSEAVPRDIAVALAADTADVALPVLQFSKILTDSDLLSLVAEQDSGKNIAIARRDSVSADLADALVATDDGGVVAELVGNDGADIRDETFSAVLDRFGDDERVQAPMVHRQKLPVAVAERLVAMVSESLCDHLMTHHELPEHVRAELLTGTRERATMSLSSVETAAELVESLARNGRLTGSIIIRSICMGDMPFFEWALARKARIPIQDARSLIHDEGKLGLRAIYRKAELAEDLYPIARAAVDVCHETDYDGGTRDRERYSRRMIERVITLLSDPAISLDQENLDYLLHRLTARCPG